MTERHIDKLESQLETLVEGAFARIFGRDVSARDLSILLLRAMTQKAISPSNGIGESVAPDSYQVQLPQTTVQQILNEYPALPNRLADLLSDFATRSGYQLNAKPEVSIVPNDDLAPHRWFVVAGHSNVIDEATKVMAAVSHVAVAENIESRPLLYIDSQRVTELTKSVVNIGRDKSNDIVIKDTYVSRKHLQLRARLGAYTLFDVDSSGGTKVNDTIVREHRLQNGDVVRIGQTYLIYADPSSPESAGNTTQLFIPK